MVTSEHVRIQVPERFVNAGLAQVGIDNYVYGIYALLLDDDTYAVSVTNTMLKINPTKTLRIKVNEVPYYEFHFDAGTAVIPDVNSVKRDTMVYNVINELMFMGHMPWYMEYDDVGKIFDTSSKFAGSSVNNSLECVELLAAIVARDREDPTKPYRLVVTDEEYKKRHKPRFIPMKSVFYAATSTSNKLAGSYFNDGIVSALVTPTTEVSRIEQLLRA